MMQYDIMFVYEKILKAFLSYRVKYWNRYGAEGVEIHEDSKNVVLSFDSCLCFFI